MARVIDDVDRIKAEITLASDQGVSASELARQYGLAISTVRRYVVEHRARNHPRMSATEVGTNGLQHMLEDAARVRLGQKPIHTFDWVTR